MTLVRTRFAPSPTGYLHIGGARTALYSWIYARKMQGKFILRIEDSDLVRSTPESVQAILDAMSWLNLNYDEGPFYQTHHLNRYQEVIAQLIKEGNAYRCYCSKERLEQMREAQLARKEKPRYDGHCRDSQQSSEAPYVVRFKNPQEGQVEFTDLIRGTLAFSNSELDDLVIARSDGTPTYNFSVVVDDWDMKITHVIRGDDHINNTPRQINILKALGAALPFYAHVPMILGPDGKRLSKRHGAVGVMHYREEGYLPQALLNYLVRLGWSHGDQEIFTMEELIQYFDLKHVQKASAAVNPEKLLWLNQHYIKTSDPQEVARELAWHMERLGINIINGPSLVDLIAIQAERCKTLREMAERSRYFYQDVILTPEACAKIPEDILPALGDFQQQLSQLSDWDKTQIHALLITSAEKYQMKLGKLAQPVRIAVTGGTVSPPLDVTLAVLGKEKVMMRLNRLTKN